MLHLNNSICRDKSFLNINKIFILNSIHKRQLISKLQLIVTTLNMKLRDPIPALKSFIIILIIIDTGENDDECIYKSSGDVFQECLSIDEKLRIQVSARREIQYGGDIGARIIW